MANEAETTTRTKLIIAAWSEIDSKLITLDTKLARLRNNHTDELRSAMNAEFKREGKFPISASEWNDGSRRPRSGRSETGGRFLKTSSLEMIVLAGAAARSVASTAGGALAECDINGDRRLSQPELTECFLKVDPILKKQARDNTPPSVKARRDAVDVTADAFRDSPSAQSTGAEPTISLQDAEAYFCRRLVNTRKPQELGFG